MKKYVILAILFFICSILLFSFCKDGCVDIQYSKFAQTVFAPDPDDSRALMDVKQEDFELIKLLFQGKILYKEDGVLSCGFSDSVAIVFDREKTFCIAQDTCAVVYWKEKDCYFNLFEWEMEKLHSILRAYGFHFPCI